MRPHRMRPSAVVLHLCVPWHTGHGVAFDAGIRFVAMCELRGAGDVAARGVTPVRNAADGGRDRHDMRRDWNGRGTART